MFENSTMLVSKVTVNRVQYASCPRASYMESFGRILEKTRAFVVSKVCYVQVDLKLCYISKIICTNQDLDFFLISVAESLAFVEAGVSRLSLFCGLVFPS